MNFYVILSIFLSNDYTLLQLRCSVQKLLLHFQKIRYFISNYYYYFNFFIKMFGSIDNEDDSLRGSISKLFIILIYLSFMFILFILFLISSYIHVYIFLDSIKPTVVVSGLSYDSFGSGNRGRINNVDRPMLHKSTQKLIEKFTSTTLK